MKIVKFINGGCFTVDMVDQKKSVPVWKKRTPAQCPELQAEWEGLFQRFYHEEGIGKSKSYEMIGDMYGVSRPTVIRFLSPQYKKYQTKYGSTKWHSEKRDPRKRLAIQKLGAEYVAVRRHLEDYVLNAYSCRTLTESLSLNQISESIQSVTEISMAPKTIEGLLNKYEANHGRPLILPVPGCENPERYKLSL